MNNKKSELFSIVHGASLNDETASGLEWRVSTEEAQLHLLSGDEAIEKSFMESTLQSSIWKKGNQKTSFLLTSVIIMKSMVGVGILGIPNVMKNFGVLISLLIMAIIMSLGICSSYLLLKCKNLSKHSNYSTIGYYIFNHRWIIYTVNLVIILSNLGTCLSELIVFGDTSQLLVNFYQDKDTSTPFYLQRTFMICVMSILLFPLLIVKSIEKLKFVSLTAILSITTFTMLVVYNFFRVSQLPDGFTFLIPEKFEIKRALAALPTLLLAYNWQFNLFPIFKGMENASDGRMLLAMITGYSMASVLYLTVGILGYATYGYDIETNYLKSIKSDDVGAFLYVVLNLTFVISTTLTLPILFFGGRNNFIQLFKSLISPNSKVIPDAKQYHEYSDKNDIRQQMLIRKRTDKCIFYGLTVFLFSLIILGAIFLNNLSLVFNIKGAVFCNAIQFVLPSLFYVTLVRKVKRCRFINPSKQLLYYSVQVLFVFSWILLFSCVACGLLK